MFVAREIKQTKWHIFFDTPCTNLVLSLAIGLELIQIREAEQINQSFVLQLQEQKD